MIGFFELLESRRGVNYSVLPPDILSSLIIVDIQDWVVDVLSRRFGQIPRDIYDEIRSAAGARVIEMVCGAHTCPHLESFLNQVDERLAYWRDRAGRRGSA